MKLTSVARGVLGGQRITTSFGTSDCIGVTFIEGLLAMALPTTIPRRRRNSSEVYPCTVVHFTSIFDCK
jgi:hypothetical protein